MGRKKSEEIKENVVDEATEKEAVTSTVMDQVVPLSDIKNHKMTFKTGETLEETKGESIEAPAEENNIEATEKVLEEKELKANTNFKDKYTNELYEKDTIFVISETTETKKIENKKYEISKARAKELKAKGYVDIN